MRFRGKVEEGGTGFLLLAVQKMDREPKNGKGRRRGKKKTILSFHPPPPQTPPPTPSFTPPIFRGVFLAPEPHGNDCCAGYTSCYIDVFQIIQNCNYSFNHTATGDIEMIKQLYSITFSISFLFYAEVFKHMLCL